MSTKKRSTYTLANAMKFKCLFDKAITTRKDYKLTPKGSPTAFQARISDALKWLIENYDKPHTNTEGKPHEAGDYAMLRGQIKLRMIAGGDIILSFFANRTKEVFDYSEIDLNDSEQVQKALGKNKESIVNWKKALYEWVENESQSGKTFRMEGLKLDEDEQLHIKQLLEGLANCIFDVDEKMIVAKVNVIKQEPKEEGQ